MSDLDGEDEIVCEQGHMGRPYDDFDRLTDTSMNIDGKWQVFASHDSISG
jgi:hypothetical protein